MAPLEGYDDRCAMCGWVGRFERRDAAKAAGSDYACGQCGTRLRYRDEAFAIVDEYGDPASSTLEGLCTGVLSKLDLHYVGVSGPLRAQLMSLEGFCESALEPPTGQGARSLRRAYQDLQNLGYVDGSFDLVVSSHVMEHVPDPDRAFDELRRVLRPSGRYIFSMPMRSSGPTVRRAVINDGEIEHLEPEHFHNSPTGRALVFNDFGEDLIDRLAALGFSARIVRPTQNMTGYLNAVVVARKLETHDRSEATRR